MVLFFRFVRTWVVCGAENSWLKGKEVSDEGGLGSFKSPEAALGLGQKPIVRECGVCV